MIAMLALLSVTLATAAPPTRDWPQWGRSPTYTSFNPVHDTSPAASSPGNATSTLAALAAKEWTFTAGDRVVGSPAVYAGRVWFGSDDGHMYVDARERGRKQVTALAWDVLRVFFVACCVRLHPMHSPVSPSTCLPVYPLSLPVVSVLPFEGTAPTNPPGPSSGAST